MAATLVGSALFLGTGAVASAQTAPRISQEVIVTATVSPVPTEWQSRTVTVLTRQDLGTFGFTSVVEALRVVPGVDLRARGPRDVQTDLSLRGATFGQNLVLVDGLRLNDSQSGHHNAEIPAAIEGIDRIEVVAGPTSSAHGADALGGAINVISRTGRYVGFGADAGQHGYAAARASLGGAPLPVDWSVTGWASRSSGFMFDREFALGGAALRGALGKGVGVDVRHQRRAFGANGFYGNSPSKEWTDQTIAALSWSRARGRFVTTARTLYRNHGDHFRWDIRTPGVAENRHRTNASEFLLTISREFAAGRRLTWGATGGGDWVRSTNLADHNYSRGGTFLEAVLPVGDRTTVVAGVRHDAYSSFGQSTSPSLSLAIRPAPSIRVRTSVARAFRIPTFTELYYHDPANLGSPDLRSEHGWSFDAGVDWFASPGWTVTISPFRRWDDDVIDWVKATAPDLWRSTNVRDVTTSGVEASVSGRWQTSLLRANVSGLAVDAPALNLLSKYVLEYARYQAGGSLSIPTVANVRLALNVDYRNRRDGQSYSLVSARVSRAFGRTTIYADGSNLLNESYREISTVVMPGRWITAGLGWSN